ncbi:SCO family protein [Pseudohongiella sp. SYSU M77423]|uniref:SCO family protein n=1 Tax=unclassified Pseudohongiella TaxID=2629611 RepID=UPI001F26CAA0|nr:MULTISPECIES: SCO family protein [unclassified Pseudohongiella]MDH7944232.1 SCO family protein [Pseudohongiella sp. SYSU M77423]MEC8859684.1 SCO family protein [Pseudomonadota bacterium]
MKKGVKLTLILCLVWVVIVFYMTYARYADNNRSAQQEQVSAEELREMGAMIYEAPVAISEFDLVDHYGQPFTEESLQGNWTMVFFGFTNCPDICPLTMFELTGFYNDLEGDPLQDDTQVVMISVDPFRDDTAKIADFMQAYHEDFLGLNGEYRQVSQLASELFIAHGIMPVPAPDGGQPQNFMVDHSGNILLIDPEGRYRGFLEPNIKRDQISETYRIIRNTL